MKAKEVGIKKNNLFLTSPTTDIIPFMRRIIPIIFIVFLSFHGLFAQFLIPAEGINDIKIGLDEEEIQWELGFKGKKAPRAQARPEMEFIATAAGLDYDHLISFQHLMLLPVSDFMVKDGKVCFVALSSYPEYNKMFCADIGTLEGLNFWDNPERVSEVYGKSTVLKNGDKTYLIYKDKGVGVEMLNNEVRMIFIFQPALK